MERKSSVYMRDQVTPKRLCELSPGDHREGFSFWMGAELESLGVCGLLTCLCRSPATSPLFALLD